MATASISDAASSDIAWVVENVIKSGGLEKPQLDDKSIEVLARHYVELGYERQILFLEDLRDRPLWALVNSFLTLTAEAGYLTAEGRAQIQIGADSIKDQREPGEATYQAFLNAARFDGVGSELWLLEHLRDQPLVTALTLIISYLGNHDSRLRLYNVGLLPYPSEVVENNT